MSVRKFPENFTFDIAKKFYLYHRIPKNRNSYKSKVPLFSTLSKKVHLEMLFLFAASYETKCFSIVYGFPWKGILVPHIIHFRAIPPITAIIFRSKIWFQLLDYTILYQFVKNSYDFGGSLVQTWYFTLYAIYIYNLVEESEWIR